MPLGKVFLIPNVLVNDDADALACLPRYIQQQAADCHCFFVETLTTARRYLKKIWPGMVIDNYPFTVIHKCEQEVLKQFEKDLQTGKNIGIISDAGCPGVADPGQILVEHAQKMGAKVVPMVGPNSILLALMASGMNGQSFQFVGYLPIDKTERKKSIQHLESYSAKNNCTQICIETPYRNMALLEEIINSCQGKTKLCIAANITGQAEYIVTKTIADWKKTRLPNLHKQPVIFLLLS